MKHTYEGYMNDLKNDQFEPAIHIGMWKHYDSLRQAKNSGFLTANSILVVFTGTLFREPKAYQLIVLVGISLLGILLCTAWFLLLTRNAAYIEYHREKAGRGNKEFWMPKSWTPRSKYLDRVPLGVFILFWIFILVFCIWYIVTS
jgi:hypothetical protein